MKSHSAVIPHEARISSGQLFSFPACGAGQAIEVGYNLSQRLPGHAKASLVFHPAAGVLDLQGIAVPLWPSDLPLELWLKVDYHWRWEVEDHAGLRLGSPKLDRFS